MIEQIYEWDFMLLEAIQTLRTPVGDKIMSFITHLGSGGAIWILAAVVFMMSKKSRLSGIKILVSLVIGLAVGTLGMKYLIARERPFTFENALITLETLIISPPSDRYSFPSGHTLSSFSSAWLMFMYNKKLGNAAIILAAAIAFSRMYLYVHFPSDILGAVILSVPIALISDKIVNLIMHR